MKHAAMFDDGLIITKNPSGFSVTLGSDTVAMDDAAARKLFTLTPPEHGVITCRHYSSSEGSIRVCHEGNEVVASTAYDSTAISNGEADDLREYIFGKYSYGNGYEFTDEAEETVEVTMEVPAEVNS